VNRILVCVALPAATLVCGVHVGAALARDRDVPRDRSISRTALLGDSVRGRTITVLERGDPDAPTKDLVVGCIHGNEPAGIGIAEQLESVPVLRERDLWVVEDANPDGVDAGTRTNARGVDLNRNFPWRWRRNGRPGDPHYSGARPLSEPESRLLARLILRLRPHVTIWFHQPFGLVDASGGSLALEREFASLIRLPLRRLPRFAGGATDWENSRLRGTTAFVVELPPGTPGPEADRHYARVVATFLRRAG
jgi:protein MpaA